MGHGAGIGAVGGDGFSGIEANVGEEPLVPFYEDSFRKGRPEKAGHHAGRIFRGSDWNRPAHYEILKCFYISFI